MPGKTGGNALTFLTHVKSPMPPCGDAFHILDRFLLRIQPEPLKGCVYLKKPNANLIY